MTGRTFGSPDVRTPPARGAHAEDSNTLDGAIVSPDADICKAEATTIALAATAGCGLYRLASGQWLLTRWGLARELPDLRAVQALLNALGARV